MLNITGLTDIGNKRSDNQDKFICKQLWGENQALLAAIDGVGGYSGGEIAADIAQRSIENYMDKPNGEILTMLKEAVVHGNNSIYDARKNDAELSSMCCVLTTAVIDSSEQKLYFVHVGDTRLYRFRNGVLEKLSKDHSLVGMKEDEKVLTEAEAMNHPHRNVILRDVGSRFHKIDDLDFMDAEMTDFLPQDTVLLCSDGLTDMITSKQIISVLTLDNTLKEKVQILIKLANEAGGKDNITVVLAKNESEKPRKTNTNESLLPIRDIKLDYQTDAENTAQKHSKKTKSKTKIWIGVGLIFLILISATWFIINRGSIANEPIKNIVKPQIKPPVSNISQNQDSLIKNNSLIFEGLGDTLFLAYPITIKDSLIAIKNGIPIVIIPSAENQEKIAFIVKKDAYFALKNVIMNGFNTAILSDAKAHVKVQNTIFRGVENKIKIYTPKDTLIDFELNK